MSEQKSEDQRHKELTEAIMDIAATGLTAIYYFYPSEDPNFKYKVGDVFMTYRDLLKHLVKQKDESDS